MYEHKKDPLISTKAFGKRMAYHVLVAVLLFVVLVGGGIIGHMLADGMPFYDALFASTTITSGLGISIIPKTTQGKLFVGLYGIVTSHFYIASSGIILAPIAHRVLHSFHLDT